jgi:mRNA interferase RelE/StbE
MPIRVEFIADAVEDLRRYARSGNIRQFLQKLVRLEAVGKQAGLPLGRGLSGYYKIVVGDRDWRIVFTVNHDETVATVLVIGDRADAACYEQAERRLVAIGGQSPEAVSLAAAILELPQFRKKSR